MPGQIGPIKVSTQEGSATYLSTRTSFWLRNLSKVNLIKSLPIAQSILVTIAPVRLADSTIQPVKGSMVVHLHIHSDATVQQSLWHVNVQVINLDFDDFGNDLVVLVSRDPY